MLIALSKMADISRTVRVVYDIPDWYILSKEEESKLIGYLTEATCFQEARFFRFLDCSAFCVESQCFFCGDHSPPQNNESQ